MIIIGAGEKQFTNELTGTVSMTFEILNFPLVLFRRLHTAERPQVTPFLRFRISFPGI